MAKNIKVMPDYKLYSLPASKIAENFNVSEFRLILNREEYSPYLSLCLHKLEEDWVATQDYEYCQVVHEWMVKHLGLEVKT